MREVIQFDFRAILGTEAGCEWASYTGQAVHIISRRMGLFGLLRREGYGVAYKAPSDPYDRWAGVKLAVRRACEGTTPEELGRILLAARSLIKRSDNRWTPLEGRFRVRVWF